MIKVTDVAYARFTSPDLDKTERFYEDFGLVRSARTDTTLYMRGTDPDHYLHVTELGDEGSFVGLAFNAAGMDDLKTLAAADGASDVEEIDGPGGGYRVRMTDPNGYLVETVFGIEPLEALPVKNIYDRNFGTDRGRKGDLVRLQRGPCQVKRLGHVVLNVESCRVNDEFYKSQFGFISSDECYDPKDKDELVVAFNRCDRGEEYVDHHTLLTVKSAVQGLGHIAFEVEDINAIYLGQGIFGIEELRAFLGRRPPHPRQPDFRLLVRSPRPPGRALDRRRSLECRQPDPYHAARGGARDTMGGWFGRPARLRRQRLRPAQDIGIRRCSGALPRPASESGCRARPICARPHVGRRHCGSP